MSGFFARNKRVSSKKPLMMSGLGSFVPNREAHLATTGAGQEGVGKQFLPFSLRIALLDAYNLDAGGLRPPIGGNDVLSELRLSR